MNHDALGGIYIVVSFVVLFITGIVLDSRDQITYIATDEEQIRGLRRRNTIIVIIGLLGFILLLIRGISLYFS